MFFLNISKICIGIDIVLLFKFHSKYIYIYVSSVLSIDKYMYSNVLKLCFSFIRKNPFKSPTLKKSLLARKVNPSHVIIYAYNIIIIF